MKIKDEYDNWSNDQMTFCRSLLLNFAGNSVKILEVSAHQTIPLSKDIIEDDNDWQGSYK